MRINKPRMRHRRCASRDKGREGRGMRSFSSLPYSAFVRDGGSVVQPCACNPGEIPRNYRCKRSSHRTSNLTTLAKVV
eukprot:scaffold1170_cov174-Amphora_coffeaeformis.AAC.20